MGAHGRHLGAHHPPSPCSDCCSSANAKHETRKLTAKGALRAQAGELMLTPRFHLPELTITFTTTFTLERIQAGRADRA